MGVELEDVRYGSRAAPAARASEKALSLAQDTARSVLVAPWQVPSVALALHRSWLHAGDTHAVRWDREGYAVMAWLKWQVV
jgi:hypothetical protein